MKKMLCLIFLSSYLFGAQCSNLIKEGDENLRKAQSTSSVSVGEYYSSLALAYYKRYEICVYYYENSNENYRVPEAKEFIKGIKAE